MNISHYLLRCYTSQVACLGILPSTLPSTVCQFQLVPVMSAPEESSILGPPTDPSNANCGDPTKIGQVGHSNGRWHARHVYTVYIYIWVIYILYTKVHVSICKYICEYRLFDSCMYLGVYHIFGCNREIHGLSTYEFISLSYLPWIQLKYEIMKVYSMFFIICSCIWWNYDIWNLNLSLNMTKLFRGDIADFLCLG